MDKPESEIAKLIPDNVVDAAAKALEKIAALSSLNSHDRARASLAAGLAAWGGMRPYRGSMDALVLPIQEPAP